jgi:hypothetical protein
MVIIVAVVGPVVVDREIGPLLVFGFRATRHPLPMPRCVLGVGSTCSRSAPSGQYRLRRPALQRRSARLSSVQHSTLERFV